ncbi:MAG: agarase [Bacteroidota bacterium]
MSTTTNPLSRRYFLSGFAALSLSGLFEPTKLLPKTAASFFRLEKRRGRWWLISSNEKPFFSLGLNHIDPASLRYPENLHIWKEKYGGSTIKWIEESVSPNLKKWRFNTVGWVQEVTLRQWQHSRSFTPEEYRALDMPYCHMLPFTQAHQWEKHTLHYDFFSQEWEEWCDYVARDHCAALSEDAKLIGYFYSDCPTWVHNRPQNEWRGPIFDPEKLESESGRKELRKLAKKYYQTTHDAIRRYDKNHLILGDRYEANARIAVEVIEEALPYVDVLSFQDFRDPVLHLNEWHQKTGKPVLLADAAKMKWQTQPGEFTRNNGKWYAKILEALIQNPGCVGFHLCGAYQRNKARRYGLLDEMEQPDAENVALIQAANEKIQRWVEEEFE